MVTITWATWIGSKKSIWAVCRFGPFLPIIPYSWCLDQIARSDHVSRFRKLEARDSLGPWSVRNHASSQTDMNDRRFEDLEKHDNAKPMPQSLQIALDLRMPCPSILFCPASRPGRVRRDVQDETWIPNCKKYRAVVIADETDGGLSRARLDGD